MKALFVGFEFGFSAYCLPLIECLGPSSELRVPREIQRQINCKFAEPILPLEQMCGNLDRANVLVCSATGREYERALVHCAMSRGLPTVQVVDSWGPYKPRFDGLMPDIVTVIDEAAIRDAVAAGIPRDKIHVVGHPRWENIKPHPVNASLSVAFLAQPIRATYGDRLGYDEKSAFDLLRSAARRAPHAISDLIIVPHPASDLTHTLGPRMRLEQALFQTNCFVGMFSSAMTDALLCGRRVLSLQPKLQLGNMCGLSRRGLVARVSTVSELISALEPPFPVACHEQLALAVKGSTNRFLTLLSELVGKRYVG